MNVVLCDDNEDFLNQLITMIKRFAFIEENSIHVLFQTTNPTELLTYIKKDYSIDCFFLDTDFRDTINGLDLAKKIRNQYPLASIIFVSSRSDMLYLTLKSKVEALDFILKDDMDKLQIDVTEALISAYEKYKKIGMELKTRYFQLNTSGFIKNIKYDDILYFKASGSSHKVTLVSKEGTYEFYDSLDDIERLNEYFYRCHRGYIINLDNVKMFDKKKSFVIMVNDEQCPVAHRRVKDFEHALQQRFS